jgi:putative transposase
MNSSHRAEINPAAPCASCPAIGAGQSIRGDEVVEIVDRLMSKRDVPTRIQCDNGREYISNKWAYDHGVTIDFSWPGKPTDNALIESFNGSFRNQCLKVNRFLSIEDARNKIEKWRAEYNNDRPHSSLNQIPPAEFKAGLRKAEDPRKLANSSY